MDRRDREAAKAVTALTQLFAVTASRLLAKFSSLSAGLRPQLTAVTASQLIIGFVGNDKVGAGPALVALMAFSCWVMFGDVSSRVSVSNEGSGGLSSLIPKILQSPRLLLDDRLGKLSRLTIVHGRTPYASVPINLFFADSRRFTSRLGKASRRIKSKNS